MIRFFLTPLIIVLFISCNSNDEGTNTMAESNMEEETNVPNTGRIRSKTNEFEFVYQYDEQDRVVFAYGENSEESLEKGYSYDQEGRIISRGEIIFMQPGNSYEWGRLYEYDSNGNIIAFENFHDLHAEVTYEENRAIVDLNNGFEIITLDIDNFGRITRIETSSQYSIFSYDSNGNLVSDLEYDLETNELMNTHIFSFDNNPNPFFRQVKSGYLVDFFFEYWWSIGPQLNNSYNYDYPYTPNNLTAITKNGDIIKTFEYDYNSENQIIGAQESDLINGSVKNYYFTYY